MTQDILQQAPAEGARTERAQLAVKTFRAMQHGLTGYARAITGDKTVEIVVSDGPPQTDGKKIYFRPPIALGDMTPHDRGKCDLRDRESRVLLCPACAIREDVLIKIYHEIAHIVFGTFEEPSDSVKKEAVLRAIEEAGTKYAERIRESWETIPPEKKRDYLNLSGLVSPFLPVVVNALEDSRVDKAMFKARRGTKVMFDAMSNQIFLNGVEQPDGSTALWSERPLNSQIMVGVFAVAHDYKIDGWFHPEVEKALADKRLLELISRMDTARSAESSYHLSFPILARLRELGFCLKPEEEEEQDEADSDESDSGDPSEGGGPEAGDGSPEDDEESDDNSPESGSEGGADSSESEEGSHPDAPSSEDSESGGEGSDSPKSGDEDDSSGDDSSGDNSHGGVSGDGEERGEPDASSEDEDSDRAGEAGGPQGSSSSSDDKGELEDDADGAGDTDAESDSGGEDREEEGDQSDGLADPPGHRDGQSDDTSRDESVSDDGDSGDPSESELDADADGDVEPVDTGADEGRGGVEVDKPDYGTADQALGDVKVFGQHEEVAIAPTPEEKADERAIDIAVIQGLYFEKPSANVIGVREHKYGQPIIQDNHDMSTGWQNIYGDYSPRDLKRHGIDADTDIPESVLGPALLEMRRVFSDNQRAAHQRHLKSGKVNQRVLGKRAWNGDERLFQKKRLPGKKSYAVLIGIDISGSTLGKNIALAKRAAQAQAELCHRMGIDFAIYAHTANGSWANYNDLYLDVYEIKAFATPWAETAKEALSKISADSENLDGHGVEYYRKLVERHSATDKVILYYSDGKMPAANYQEELEILQREIAYCKSHNITLMGVGIRTDSPRRHGLETVQVDDDSDIAKVVRHLQSGLLHNR